MFVVVKNAVCQRAATKVGNLFHISKTFLMGVNVATLKDLVHKKAPYFYGALVVYFKPRFLRRRFHGYFLGARRPALRSWSAMLDWRYTVFRLKPIPIISSFGTPARCSDLIALVKPEPTLSALRAIARAFETLTLLPRVIMLL
jgi:hypothetical protein